MPDPYLQLLDGAIHHLEALRARGVRSVAVQPATLAALRARRGAPRRPPGKPKALPAATVVPPPPPVPLPVKPAASLAAATLPKPAPTPPATVPPTGSGRGGAPVNVPISPPSAAAPAQQRSLDLSARGRRPGTREAREAAMAELRARARACTRCPHLASSRTQVVFGVGDMHSPLLFVGEAPGADEDAQGEPFVGAAGQLLTKIIGAMDLSRSTVYIANILKCRPDTPGQPSGNRPPLAEEMATCLPYLLEQIELIGPKVIVALGTTAVGGLLGKTEGITRLRGHWREFQGIPLMPTYHPAYLLRNHSLGVKREVWEDMLQVMEKLGLPISRKQRRYFLLK